MFKPLRRFNLNGGWRRWSCGRDLNVWLNKVTFKSIHSPYSVSSHCQIYRYQRNLELDLLVCTCFKLILTHFCNIWVTSWSESNRAAQHAAAQCEREKVCSSEVSVFILLLLLFRSECCHTESSLRSTHLTLSPPRRINTYNNVSKLRSCAHGETKMLWCACAALTKTFLESTIAYIHRFVLLFFLL